jgi:crotonyl-CoA carboxylase/reductase
MHGPSEQMTAWVIREDRFGPPRSSLAIERVATPPPGRGEVLIRVMAAGVNPNTVFAGLGAPLNVLRFQRELGLDVPFHVPGSDASGIVSAVGPGVARVRVGDAVVVHGGSWDPDCAHVRDGGDPILSPTSRAWGYQTRWGALADYCVAQEHQCLPKPARLTWEEAAAYLVSAATAYRMLHRFEPHVVRPGDVVLIWGAAGGLGCQAIQLVRQMGGLPVGVVSSADRAAFCRELGAVGCIDRKRFDHWGTLPHWRDTEGRRAWLASARAFRDAIHAVLGEKRDPRIVFEHPGEATFPTSVFVCDRDGMVVYCGGSTGFQATFDLRLSWTWQKRIQGSHGMNDDQSAAVNALVAQGVLDPCLSETFPFEQAAEAHHLLHVNRQAPGNMVVLVGAERAGLGRGNGENREVGAS